MLHEVVEKVYGKIMLHDLVIIWEKYGTDYGLVEDSFRRFVTDIRCF